MKTRVMTTAALLAAAAMILSYVESLLPSVGIPGVKMGLANIAVIFALYRLGWRLAAWISLVQGGDGDAAVRHSGGAGVQPGGGGFEPAGHGGAPADGAVFPHGGKRGGGVAHNAGQILVAMWLLETRQLAWYFPVLAAAGVGGGILTGLCGGLLLRYVPDKPR